MYNGILNLYKEQGFTSFDAVAKLRGILHQKKIGHTGTLDPLAEGVLVMLLGSATKLSDILTSDHKEYEAEMKLGCTSDTDDITGNTVYKTGCPEDDHNEATAESEEESGRDTNAVVPTNEEIEAAVMSFVGSYDQLPPMYAAIKVDGKKLYEYAREGKSVERTPRKVDIHEIKIMEINYPYVRFYVKCSKGTYIRSLCRDIGEKLGIGALMSGLTRKEAGNFRIEESLKFSEIEELVKSGKIEEVIKPVDYFMQDLPKATVSTEHEKYLLNGNKLSPDGLVFSDEAVKEAALSGKMVRVYLTDEFRALYTYDEREGLFRPYKMFMA